MRAANRKRRRAIDGGEELRRETLTATNELQDWRNAWLLSGGRERENGNVGS